MAGGGGGDGDPEFQIAPMIDVLLVLLVFFMSITSAQVVKVEAMPLPVAPNALKKDQMRSEAIVNIRWDAKTEKPTYRLEGKEYKDFKLLAPQLKLMKDVNDRTPSRSGNPRYRVVIRAEKDVHALVINRVMDLAGQAGIDDIAFGVYNKEEG
jgi:biopolymer transport protein ExbD